ncbi:MAG: sigma-70 family RNA polymerase sigma factor [Chitinophagaceae bacterium]
MIARTDLPMIWSRFKNGDRKALESIYKTYVNILVNYGLKITSDADLVKDCIQDLFVELWKSRQRLVDTTDPKFYLFRALRNKLSRALAQQSFVSEAEIQLSADSLVTGYIELEIAAKEQDLYTYHKVHQLLNKLPRRQHEVIYLRFYHNFSYETISSLMNMNYQSVLNLMSRALKTLRKGYQPITLQK